MLLGFFLATAASAERRSTELSESLRGVRVGDIMTREPLRAPASLTVDTFEGAAAADAMNRETALRKRMTPEVLDDMGDCLAAAAVQCGCGARFTGAGGGGCILCLPDDDPSALCDALKERGHAPLRIDLEPTS